MDFRTLVYSVHIILPLRLFGHRRRTDCHTDDDPGPGPIPVPDFPERFPLWICNRSGGSGTALQFRGLRRFQIVFRQLVFLFRRHDRRLEHLPAGNPSGFLYVSFVEVDAGDKPNQAFFERNFGCGGRIDCHDGNHTSNQASR